MIKKQFTLYLENKPGALARITRKLAQSKVNIEGISVATSPDVGLIQMVVSNSVVTRRLLKELGIAFTVQEVAIVSLANAPGALAHLLSLLAARKLNLNYVYATGGECKHGCHCYAIISAPDLKKVEDAWRQK